MREAKRENSIPKANSQCHANSNPDFVQHFPRITSGHFCTFVALRVYNGPTRIRSKKNKRARRKPPACFQWRGTARTFANPLHQTKKRQGVIRHQTDLLVRIMESIILLQYNHSSKFYSLDWSVRPLVLRTLKRNVRKLHVQCKRDIS